MNLQKILKQMKGGLVACSGGVDSLLLSSIAHDVLKPHCVILHVSSPAVPNEATRRIQNESAKQNWSLQMLETGEFQDENYLKNPTNRCYYCKHHLYSALNDVSIRLATKWGFQPSILSGTNIDDLKEFRPGLQAAKKFHVRHPFVEAGLSKHDIRTLSSQRGLSSADLPASPCLSSRLYTGTRVTKIRLQAVHEGETYLQQKTGIDVIRCRLKNDDMLVEVPAEHVHKMTSAIIKQLEIYLGSQYQWLQSVHLDSKPYAPGRSFVGAT